MSNKNKNENPNIIYKVAVADSIRAIKPGSSATFTCTEFASYSCARGQVCKFNAAAGRAEYSISTPDNGISFTITHN